MRIGESTALQLPLCPQLVKRILDAVEKVRAVPLAGHREDEHAGDRTDTGDGADSWQTVFGEELRYFAAMKRERCRPSGQPSVETSI